MANVQRQSGSPMSLSWLFFFRAASATFQDCYGDAMATAWILFFFAAGFASLRPFFVS
jgi:hypothetical protein